MRDQHGVDAKRSGRPKYGPDVRIVRNVFQYRHTSGIFQQYMKRRKGGALHGGKRTARNAVSRHFLELLHIHHEHRQRGVGGKQSVDERLGLVNPMAFQ